MRAALFTSNPLAAVAPPPLYSLDDSTMKENEAKSRTMKTINNTKNSNIVKECHHENAETESHPKDSIGSPWRTFHPQTNLIWLNFVLGRLMGMLDERERLQQRRQKRQKKVQKKVKNIEEISVNDIDNVTDKLETVQINRDDDSEGAKMVAKTYTKTTKVDAETETEKKLLERRARLLTRTLRRVQRALNLDALAGKRTMTAAAAKAPEMTGSRRAVAGSRSIATAAKAPRRVQAQVEVQVQIPAPAQASVRSTTELVGWAVAEGWLDLEDVVM